MILFACRSKMMTCRSPCPNIRRVQAVGCTQRSPSSSEKAWKIAAFVLVIAKLQRFNIEGRTRQSNWPPRSTTQLPSSRRTLTGRLVWPTSWDKCRRGPKRWQTPLRARSEFLGWTWAEFLGWTSKLDDQTRSRFEFITYAHAMM